MERSRIEYPGSPEGPELNSIECCALNAAFMENPAAVARLEGVVSKKELAILADELKRTEHLTFPPDIQTTTVYFQMAVAELKRLEHGHAALFCGHSVDDHKKALRAVEAKFAEPVN